jgi:hypothetical protein
MSVLGSGTLCAAYVAQLVYGTAHVLWGFGIYEIFGWETQAVVLQSACTAPCNVHEKLSLADASFYKM